MARIHAECFLFELHLPQLPSIEEIRRIAERRIARTPWLEEIVRRTREILLAAVLRQLLSDGAASGPAAGASLSITATDPDQC